MWYILWGFIVQFQFAFVVISPLGLGWKRSFGASLLDWQMSQPITVSWGAPFTSLLLIFSKHLDFPGYDMAKIQIQAKFLSGPPWNNPLRLLLSPQGIYTWPSISFWSALAHYTSYLVLSATCSQKSTAKMSVDFNLFMQSLSFPLVMLQK